MPDAQLALLHAPGAAPEGFLYTENLISAGEEGQLVECLRDLPFREFEFQGYRGKRRVVSFGLHYDFGRGKLQPAAEMPGFYCRCARRRRGLPGCRPMSCRMF